MNSMLFAINLFMAETVAACHKVQLEVEVSRDLSKKQSFSKLSSVAKCIEIDLLQMNFKFYVCQ